MRMEPEPEAVIASEEELSRLDPVHAVYVYAQNKMDVFVAQLSSVPAVKKLVKICVDDEELFHQLIHSRWRTPRIHSLLSSISCLSRQIPTNVSSAS